MIGNYINGNHINKNHSSKFIDIYDPSKGESVDKVILSNKKDFDDVMQSSKNAFISWSSETPLKGLEFYKSINILEKNIETLAKIISTEHGKTLDDAKDLSLGFGSS